jgi:hypothetical protein
MDWLDCVSGSAAGILASISLASAQHPSRGMTHAPGAIMYHAPTWSPDGSWILASANRDGDTEIYLVRGDGGELRQLTRNTVADDIARWSDDGRRVVFESDRAGPTATYSMNPDGSDVRPAARDSVTSRSADGRPCCSSRCGRVGGGCSSCPPTARTYARSRRLGMRSRARSPRTAAGSCSSSVTPCTKRSVRRRSSLRGLTDANLAWWPPERTRPGRGTAARSCSRRGTRGAGSCGSLRSRPQRVNLVGWRPAFTHTGPGTARGSRSCATVMTVARTSG